jgi:hypothetical protein
MIHSIRIRVVTKITNRKEQILNYFKASLKKQALKRNNLGLALRSAERGGSSWYESASGRIYSYIKKNNNNNNNNN